MINEQILNDVEKALDIKLYDGQKQYLLNENTYWFGGRRSGKTLVYCIKLALSEGEPLDMNHPEKYIDDDYGNENNRNHYAKYFFRDTFLDIWYQLKESGIKVRDIRLNKSIEKTSL